ncbi:heavy metal-associated domain-containing protein [Halovibrio sp. HP20-50]|jgi:copper chaperone CopZ|uniref:heavy-metal-associated domain-containing protein n=1 Tax=Halovibrio sp. HP20-59 TaxID=3080275 RepID=UPI00294AAA68|nr:heavy metal-associated domain-containing protein [Halovibrio sp. HP20-59]MEA2118793.1 heavy metal-associated domain-containing protein [Halovibrio sp. HP20-59]
MKRFITGIAAMLMLAWGSSAAAETYVLTIEGFGCDLCAHSVQSRLEQLTAVEEVRASFEDSEAFVQTQDGTVLTEDKAREIVEGAGFTLTNYQHVTAEQ